LRSSIHAAGCLPAREKAKMVPGAAGNTSFQSRHCVSCVGILQNHGLRKNKYEGIDIMKKRSFEEQQRFDQQQWYDEMHTTQVKLKLNKKTDKDILDWLFKQRMSRDKTMQGEIKRLIREEIAKSCS
jgi:hypothetical protein